MKVLISDDNESLRLLMRRLIQRRFGYEVFETNNGMKAWQALDSGMAADLCILDMCMPGLSGMELLAKLRADARFQYLPVIMCTAEDNRATVLNAASLGLSGYLIKPFDSEILLSLVQKACESGPTAAVGLALEPVEASLKRLGVERKTYLDLLKVFTKEVAGVIGDLRVPPAETNRQDVETRLSGLGGAGRTLGAGRIAAEIMRSVKIVSAGDPFAIQSCLETLEKENENVIAALAVVASQVEEELLSERPGQTINPKAKSETVVQAKRYDDPIRILVVDDKPAIVEQIRSALADTAWNVAGADEPGQALDDCIELGVDVVLASLSLPKDGAYKLFQNLQAYARLAGIPVFGLCVKTVIANQERAKQAGFTGIIGKPIDAEELKSKVSRALRLQTSYKYFQQRDGLLTLTLPKDFLPGVALEVGARLEQQLTGMVDAGGSRLIIDLSPAETASISLIEFLTSVAQFCETLSIAHAIVGSKAFMAACRSYEDSRSWLFANTFEEARVLLR